MRLRRGVFRALQPFPSLTANNSPTPQQRRGLTGINKDNNMLTERKLLWLTPLEWSLLAVSVALCGYVALAA